MAKYSLEFRKRIVHSLRGEFKWKDILAKGVFSDDQLRKFEEAFYAAAGVVLGKRKQGLGEDNKMCGE